MEKVTTSRNHASQLTGQHLLNVMWMLDTRKGVLTFLQGLFLTILLRVRYGP